MEITVKLFQLFKRKKNKNIEKNSEEQAGEQQNSEVLRRTFVPQTAFRAQGREEVQQFVENSCQQMGEAYKQLEEEKTEYTGITSTLKDIQIITDMPDEVKLELGVAADRIVGLNQEREHYQKKPSKITEIQYMRIDGYGEEIRNIMKKMDDDEKYSQVIQDDMEKLEGEKASLKIEQEDYQNHLEMLQKLAQGVIFLFCLNVIFFFVTAFVIQEDYLSVVYVVLAVIGILLAIIFSHYQKTKQDLRLCERKINKAIGLLNKVKVRYVNITNSLEYQYTKYGVKSAFELNHLWGLYLETKKERELYRHNSAELHEAETELLAILSDFQLENPRIWIQQALALLDPREMVEVRHDLNIRRQKLREAMEYNKNVIEQTNKGIQEFVKMNKEYADQILEMVKKSAALLDKIK